MIIKRPRDVRSSEITDERLYLRRREFMRLTGGALVGAAATGALAACGHAAADSSDIAADAAPSSPQTAFSNITKRLVTTQDPPNTYEQITGYNNFYEFGMGKSDPKQYAGKLTTRPWTVKIDGLCNKPGDYHLEDLIKPADLEERVYRHRCVEAWSMVIPWIGVPLASILERVEPTGKAAFVEFTTVLRPSEMPALSEVALNWPYKEGLRLDEAMNSLTLLAVGLYGKTLLNQNGAPIRLVVPWKYGFKGAKSIVRIRLTDKMPSTTWVEQNPAWYGFYSNVNPDVSPVRWDQSRERRLPSLFATTKTLMFNGYGDQVASMYQNLDLKKFY
jgi:sulfoxide reductase catalytic subunit YedY